MKASCKSWEFLLNRYAKGRKVCKCGEAYENPDIVCPGGCLANMARTKKEVSNAVVAEFMSEQMPLAIPNGADHNKYI